MTGIIDHKIRRITRRPVRHTYLVDVGNTIDIPMMEVSELFESCPLDPPYRKTRFFKIEIDEKRENKTTTVLFRNIFPVQADRGPDWRILKFLIRRGSWTITERIHFPTDSGEAQWLYTDDFNLLFLSSGGRHDLDMLIQLITGKLTGIAQSFGAGNPVPSEFENQRLCRSAFDTIFKKGIDGAFRDAVIYRDYGLKEPGTHRNDLVSPSGAEYSCTSGRAMVGTEEAAGLYIDINDIEDLRDLSWLSN